MNEKSIKPAENIEGQPIETLPEPGEFPYTRGIYKNMYKDRPWTIRQYSGFDTPEGSNKRLKDLIIKGATGISLAFDLPTQLGLDSDNPLSSGEVGKVGVAVNVLDDMRNLFDEISLDTISTSMTINAPAAILVLMYEIVANERGIDSSKLRGTCQNDILKEYIARGTYIYPPEPSMRLTVDLIEYCARNLPNWNPISVSGYHMAEAGATAAQEIAYTFANAQEYIREILKRGLSIDDFAPRISFFFVSRLNLIEEVSKFRAAREIWAELMLKEFKATKDKSKMMRFHAQTAGAELKALNPELNIIRVTTQALAAIFGGAQSIHTNSYDEALSIPSESAAFIATQTQTILAKETGLTEHIDPFGGSYLIETMTKNLKKEILGIMSDIEARGGALRCIEHSYQKANIEEAAYQEALNYDRFQKYDENNATTSNLISDKLLNTPDFSPEKVRKEKMSYYKINRKSELIELSLRKLSDGARSDVSLIPLIKDSILEGATLGEICETLKIVFGVYKPVD